jgi:putative hydrolase of the HAD superfamily
MAAQPIRDGSSGRPPRALLLDAMGTLLTFAPPAPLLREALRERLGEDVGAAAAAQAIRAEIAYYRAHLHLGRDADSLAALRRASAEAMRPVLGPAAARAPGGLLTDALLAALRFRAFPDAAPALRALRAAGLRLVVVSNWDVSLRERLAETGLEALVDATVASAPFGAAKPDPAIFAHALGLAGGVAPADAWHVGDSLEADVAGARAAGIAAALLRRGDDRVRRPGLAGARVPVIASLAELPALVGLREPAAGEYPQRRRR